MHYMLRYFSLCIALAGALALAPAHAMQKIALVVGNDDYQNVVSLQKAVNDAQTISQTLTGLGFDVILATDVTRREFNQRLQEFGSDK